MKKSIPLIIVLSVSVFLFMVLFLCTYYSGARKYLSGDEPLTVPPNRTAALIGPWDFTWDARITEPVPERADETVRLPHQWNKFPPDRGYPVYGQAAYSMTLKTTGMHGTNAFFIPPVSSACRLFINGAYTGESGIPGGTIEGETSSGKPLIAYYEQTTDALDIVLQVSNHAMYTGGFTQGSIEYGRAEDIQSRYAVLILGDAFLLVLLLAIGIISLFRFFQNTREIQNIVFAAISVLFAFRVLLTGMTLVYTIFPFFTVRAAGYSMILTYYFGLPLFLVYFYYSFPEEFSKGVVLASFIVAAAAGVAVFFIEPASETIAVTVYGGFILLGGIYILIGLARAIRCGRPNATVVFLASVIIIGCALNDILHYGGIVRSILLMNVGIGVFGLTQLIILGTASQRTIRELYGVHHRLSIMESWQEMFFSTAAEDLRKPLKGINEVADSLLRGSLGPITSDQLGGLSLINASSLQLSNMVHDILDFRRIREGNVDVSRRMFNLFLLMERVRTAAALLFREKGLEFKNEVPREMENLYTDENLTERAFFNIARSFADYAGGGACAVSAETTDENTVIRVTWESEGIDRESIGKALSMFDQLGQRDKGEEITSKDLVLSIARRICEILGGSLHLEEGNNVNPVLTVLLPRVEVDIDQETATEEEARLDALINLEPVLEDVVLTRNIDIMVVSPDLMDLQVMKSQLASMNYNVIPVTSGHEALDKIQEKCPNLVLLDVNLHTMSGYEVCSRIREHWSSSELPVILITEKERVSDLIEGLTSGANDFLARPYHMEEFLTRVNTHIQLARINQMYSRFVPTEFLNTLGQENIIDLKLGDQVQREMTVLFVDIRAFTNLSENMTPQENFKFINSYLSRFSPMITRNKGFVDKFIGDAIMALYPGKPEDAIATALEMVEHVKVYNSHRANCGYKAINIGIGIHTGNLILGIIGDDQRMQGTVISDAVNLASRIQDVTKLYHTNIVISQETFVKLENPMSYDFRFLGKVKVKGKAKSVSLFEIFNGDDEEIRKSKSETKNDFETAIILFAKRRFEEASVIFQDIAEKNPNDYASALFLDRAKKFMAAEKRAFFSSL